MVSDFSNDELEGVTRLFVNLGAEPAQATVMASQLLKRASQIAEARGISMVESTESLLKQVVEARRGEGSGTDRAS